MKFSARLNSRNTLATAVLSGLALTASPAAIAGDGNDYSGKMKDAWLDGRIETAFTLNQHLNPFAIDTSVAGGVVTLEGQVESDIDRDLAAEIAMNVEGVEDVDNRLQVSGESTMAKMSGAAKATADDFMGAVKDATITATVKTKLLANENTKGLSIDVDTSNDVVTLSGAVSSSEERDLAAALASNVSDVDEVNNRLIVISQ